MNLARSNSNFKSNETTNHQPHSFWHRDLDAKYWQSRLLLLGAYTWVSLHTHGMDGMPHTPTRPAFKMQTRRKIGYQTPRALLGQPRVGTQGTTLPLSRLIHFSIYIHRSSLGRHSQGTGYLLRDLPCFRPSYSDHDYNTNVPEDPDGVRGCRLMARF
ncbi:uncharacterized protein MCYG_03729 [Microsporum canis CBS 113480]|uniref:Uncharacterized protein n=1 Tax=Arthroderma otae (strain ATCC MYA-4605 / CBS 113480) TaxID=554155 RepID=C5FJP9_ARTOC|nr:uncharacterized protein MCYG_03729 [Microsporum canis CBS 113480]EEQ30910.1 predicted protein [Microsporum canis CBS 113480]